MTQQAPWTPARLDLLRAELATRGLTAFIVPRFDAHQGEYIAPHDERLRYVTGFSGSAGVAVVLADRIVLFVDGRYQVQARGETDPAHVEIVEDVYRKIAAGELVIPETVEEVEGFLAENSFE